MPPSTRRLRPVRRRRGRVDLCQARHAHLHPPACHRDRDRRGRRPTATHFEQVRLSHMRTGEVRVLASVRARMSPWAVQGRGMRLG